MQKLIHIDTIQSKTIIVQPDKLPMHHKCEKQNNRANKIITTHSIYLEFILHYIKITSYYIVKDTFKSQLITAT